CNSGVCPHAALQITSAADAHLATLRITFGTRNPPAKPSALLDSELPFFVPLRPTRGAAETSPLHTLHRAPPHLPKYLPRRDNRVTPSHALPHYASIQPDTPSAPRLCRNPEAKSET